MIIQSVRVPLDRSRLIFKVLIAQHFRGVMVTSGHIVRLGQCSQDPRLTVVSASDGRLAFHLGYAPHFALK